MSCYEQQWINVYSVSKRVSKSEWASEWVDYRDHLFSCRVCRHGNSISQIYKSQKVSKIRRSFSRFRFFRALSNWHISNHKAKRGRESGIHVVVSLLFALWCLLKNTFRLCASCVVHTTTIFLSVLKYDRTPHIHPVLFVCNYPNYKVLLGALFVQNKKVVRDVADETNKEWHALDTLANNLSSHFLRFTNLALVPLCKRCTLSIASLCIKTFPFFIFSTTQ